MGLVLEQAIDAASSRQQPQLNEQPYRKAVPRTFISTPQSHLQSQSAFPLNGLQRSLTVSLP